MCECENRKRRRREKEKKDTLITRHCFLEDTSRPPTQSYPFFHSLLHFRFLTSFFSTIFSLFFSLFEANKQIRKRKDSVEMTSKHKHTEGEREREREKHTEHFQCLTVTKKIVRNKFHSFFLPSSSYSVFHRQHF